MAVQSDAAHSAQSIHFRLTFIVVTRYVKLFGHIGTEPNDRNRTWPGSATTGTPGIQRAPSFFPMMAASTPPRQIFTPLMQLARPHKPGNNDTVLPGKRENREIR